MNASQLINQNSGDTEYYTPPEIIEAARECMGGIDLDPASSAAANKIVKAKSFFDKQLNGLQNVWRGRIWLNHPFGRKTNPLWIAKLLAEYHLGQTTEACCLTYACTSETWFHPLFLFPQCFLSPRTNFYLPNGSLKRGVTKGSVVTFLTRDTRNGILRFRSAFGKLGAIKI